MRVRGLKNGLKPMNRPNKIPIDQPFQEAFETFEPGFQSGDWDDMLSRLESNETPVILLPPKHIFTNTKNTIIMILITTLTAGMLWMTGPQEAITSNVPNTTPIIESVTTQTLPQSTSLITETDYATAEINQVNTNGFVTQADLNLKHLISSLVESKTPEFSTGLSEAEINSDLDFSLATPNAVLTKVAEIVTPDTAKFLKTVVSKYWVDTTYKYVYYEPSRDIEEGWIGIYYTNQHMQDATEWDRIGRLTETNGFNLQFMSGNLLPGENLAIYGGLDWGMQFYGRSDKSEVLINSVNEDRGLTFLRSHSNDIFISGQIEWAQTRVVPYLTGSVGTRILSTGQTTRALLASTEYESTQDNGVHTRATMALKAGVGVKFKLSPHVYFDARYEIVQTDMLRTVDYSNTAFNGLSFDLGLKKMNMSADQFRFGFVFDVSGNEYKKVVDEPGHWEETTQRLYTDPSDSTKLFVPCPCDKPKRQSRNKKNNNSRNTPINEGPSRFPGSEGGIFSPGSGSGSGSGKGGFPGLKKPPVRW